MYGYHRKKLHVNHFLKQKGLKLSIFLMKEKVLNNNIPLLSIGKFIPLVNFIPPSYSKEITLAIILYQLHVQHVLAYL